MGVFEQGCSFHVSFCTLGGCMWVGVGGWIFLGLGGVVVQLYSFYPSVVFSCVRRTSTSEARRHQRASPRGVTRGSVTRGRDMCCSAQRCCCRPHAQERAPRLTLSPGCCRDTPRGGASSHSASYLQEQSQKSALVFFPQESECGSGNFKNFSSSGKLIQS